MVRTNLDICEVGRTLKTLGSDLHHYKCPRLEGHKTIETFLIYDGWAEPDSLNYVNSDTNLVAIAHTAWATKRSCINKPICKPNMKDTLGFGIRKTEH
jgi:hypothetical protein